MGRRKKRRDQTEVTLNLAAMLDMAFQLLTFFILTFRAAPVEGQISLRLPPPQSVVVVQGGQPAGSDYDNKSPVQGVNTLTVTVFADPKTGLISSLGVLDTMLPSIAALEGKLKEYFADPGNPFDQVIVQVSDTCRYDELMRIVDICTRQTLPDGKKLSKLSFVELPSSVEAPG
jgi:biopolymer transport protein ExbD